MYDAFAFELGSPECGIRSENQRPVLSPEWSQTVVIIKETLKDRTIKQLGWVVIRTSALLSAFLRRSRINFADLTGQRPCPFECLFLAWAVRPTPPQKRRNGIACLWARTSSKYLFALAKGNFLRAWAVSRVFYKHKHKNHNGYSK